MKKDPADRMSMAQQKMERTLVCDDVTEPPNSSQP